MDFFNVKIKILKFYENAFCILEKNYLIILELIILLIIHFINRLMNYKMLGLISFILYKQYMYGVRIFFLTCKHNYKNPFTIGDIFLHLFYLLK